MIQRRRPNTVLAEQSSDVPATSEALHKCLSSAFVLRQVAQNFHWNVRGPLFGQLHCLTGQLYETLDKDIDHLAERIRSLDVLVAGKIGDLTSNSAVAETADPRKVDALGMVDVVVKALAAHGETLHAADALAAQTNDGGSSNMLQAMIETGEKFAWKFRSYLQG